MLKFFMREADRLGGSDYLMPANNAAQKICDWLDVEEIRVGSRESDKLDFLQYELNVAVEIYELCNRSMEKCI